MIQRKKNLKLKKIKDKEGIIFLIALDPEVKPKSREKESVQFVKKIIENKLKSKNVYPENNKIGFHGDLDHISFFIGGLIDCYIIENQLDVK